jgi:hypothetical protein
MKNIPYGVILVLGIATLFQCSPKKEDPPQKIYHIREQMRLDAFEAAKKKRSGTIILDSIEGMWKEIDTDTFDIYLHLGQDSVFEQQIQNFRYEGKWGIDSVSRQIKVYAKGNVPRTWQIIRLSEDTLSIILDGQDLVKTMTRE